MRIFETGARSKIGTGVFAKRFVLLVVSNDSSSDWDGGDSEERESEDDRCLHHVGKILGRWWFKKKPQEHVYHFYRVYKCTTGNW